MNKMISLITMLLILILLASCEKNNNDSKTSSDPTPTSADRVGNSQEIENVKRIYGEEALNIKMPNMITAQTQSVYDEVKINEARYERLLNENYETIIFTKEQTGLIKPDGILVRNDEIIVCDSEKSALVVLDLDGNFLRDVGGIGIGPLEFNYPTGIYMRNDKVYVIDSFNQRIQILTADLEYLDEMSFKNVTIDINKPNLNFYAVDVVVTDEEAVYFSTLYQTPDAARIFYGTDSKDFTSTFAWFQGFLAMDDIAGKVYAINFKEYVFADGFKFGTMPGECYIYEVDGLTYKTIGELPYGHHPHDFLVINEKIYAYMLKGFDVFDLEGNYLESLAVFDDHSEVKGDRARHIAVDGEGNFYIAGGREGSIYKIQKK